MSELSIVSDGIYEFGGEKWISPFSKFNPKSKPDNEVLVMWQEHYTKLGIKTVVHRGLLLVNLKNDQAVWPREYHFGH